MALEARCKTTAMGIMPYTSIDEALELSLSLDIPYWPQLPRISFYQDMFAQTSQNFPGIEVDIENRRLRFDTARFQQELLDYSLKIDKAETFALTGEYASVYKRFLKASLSRYHAIRGQIAGPITLGFVTLDEEHKPIIYNAEVKGLLFDFVQRKANAQYHELKKKNRNAFVWIDEPGLSFVFSGMYGYNDYQAKEDYQELLQGLDGPRGLHLCPNVNLPYLLQLGADILSFDAYQLGFMPKEYAGITAEFLKKGGIISWGIVPTEAAILAQETPETLATRLINYWEATSRSGKLSVGQIAEQSLLAPAKCSVKELRQKWAGDDDLGQTSQDEPGAKKEVRAVNKAFGYLREVSGILKDRYDLE